MKKIIPVLCLALLAACDQTPTQQLDNPGTVISDVEKQPEADAIAVGKTAKAEGVDLTLESVKTSNYVGLEGAAPKLDPSETYVIATFKLKNTSSKSLNIFEWPKLNLTDTQGNSYVADDIATAMAVAMATTESAISTDLNPGIATKWVTVWKVAKKGFDEDTWKLVAETSPEHTFALK